MGTDHSVPIDFHCTVFDRSTDRAAIGNAATPPRAHAIFLRVIFSMTEKFQRRERLSLEERKARDLVRRAEAEQAMREHAAAREAFHQNRERLKAERGAREAREKRT
jgi:hypothetical protein